MNLDQINKEINELSTKRLELLKEKEKSIMDDFLRLEWIKDTIAVLTIEPFQAAGLPWYRILLFMPKIPKISYSQSFYIYGDPSKSYEQYISYKHSDYLNECPLLTTNNHQVLIEFLQKYRFKRLNYDETSLEILKVAEAHNEKTSNEL